MSAAVARPTRDVSAEIAGMIKKIHVAKRQMALVDGSYRALLVRVTGSNRLTGMSAGALEKVLTEFQRLGWKPKRTNSDKAQVRAIYALWHSMSDLVSISNDNALRSFVERQTGLDDPEFCTPEQLNKVMEGLKAWKARQQKIMAATGLESAQT